MVCYFKESMHRFCRIKRTKFVQQLSYIQGRENVKSVCMDLSISYRSFARDFFPNAKIIADKFHMERLPVHSLQKYLKQVKTDTKEHKIRRRLQLKNSFKLKQGTRAMTYEWLELHPTKNIYLTKETLIRFIVVKMQGMHEKL